MTHRSTDRLRRRRLIEAWPVRLGSGGDLVDRCSALLSADEWQRARDFRLEHLRDRFTITRGVLRALLARYVDAAANSLRFVYGRRGKPALDGAAAGVEFNLSHSHEIAVYVIAPDGMQIGVDVEWLRPITEAGPIAMQ